MASEIRKSLHELQPSATNQTILVGLRTGRKEDGTENGAKDDKSANLKCNKARTGESSLDKENNCDVSTNKRKKGIKSSKNKICKKLKRNESIQTITDPENSILYSYWKDLAEQRRIALVEILEENENLDIEKAVLEAEITELKKYKTFAEELVQIDELVNYALDTE